MKKLLLFCITLSLSAISMATVHTITNSGFTFTPANLTIDAGDTVVWNIGNTHNVVEVDSSTWSMNGNTSNGGVTLGFGGGMHKFTSTGSFFYVCSPHASGGMKGKITVESVTSIEEQELQPNFSFYPNPVKEQIQLELGSSDDFSEIQLISIEGKEVSRITVNTANPRINVMGITPGNYVLVLRNDKGIVSRKVIIE
jgi:plastocyanin